MKYKLIKDRKGIAQMFVFLIVVAVLLFFFFSLGGISSFILKSTFQKIPPLFWVGLIIFILIVLRKKKK